VVLLLLACPRPIAEREAELALLRACAGRVTRLEERANAMEKRIEDLEDKPLSLTINAERLDGLMYVGKGLGTAPKLPKEKSNDHSTRVAGSAAQAGP